MNTPSLIAGLTTWKLLGVPLTCNSKSYATGAVRGVFNSYKSVAMPPTVPLLAGVLNLFAEFIAELRIVMNCSYPSGLFASSQKTLVLFMSLPKLSLSGSFVLTATTFIKPLAGMFLRGL